MSLLDSNIIIGAAKIGAEALRELIADELPSASVVSYIEVLGYHRLTEADRQDFEAFFSAIPLLSISSEIVEQAVKLRQIRKMSLGDAIVAGTALVHCLTLITRNTKDFVRVEGLTLADPLEET